MIPARDFGQRLRPKRQMEEQSLLFEGGFLHWSQVKRQKRRDQKSGGPGRGGRWRVGMVARDGGQPFEARWKICISLFTIHSKAEKKGESPA